MKENIKEISGIYSINMVKKAIIISLSGPRLKKEEHNLFKKNIPWGVILFKRNIKNINQLKKLILSIRNITKDNKFPILIDEEGGDVSRLQSIFYNGVYSQKFFGDLYEKNPDIGISIYKYYINEICSLFKDLKININTVPVLDKLSKNTNNFLKNRVYSSKKKIIKILSNICIETYKKNKIFTVIKHIPGHGQAKSDSHKKLPVVNKSKKFLLNNDFDCFKSTKSLFAMTAHVKFTKIDNKYCVTHSKKNIKNFIREKIKFKGILISDDVGMKSLKYSVLENALRAINAGCNLALYCDGKYQVSRKLLKKIPPIDEFTAKKTSEFYKFLR